MAVKNSPGSAVVQGATEGLIETVLGVPRFIDKQDTHLTNLFNDQLEKLFGAEAASMLFPRKQRGSFPTGREALAGGSALVGMLGGIPFEEGLPAEMASLEENAASNPGSFTTGRFLGADVAPLLLARLPRSGPGGVFDKPIQDAIDDAATKAGARAGTVGVSKELQELLESQRFQDIMRGAGRSVETGLEGAALSLAQGGDPAETFAYAMGAQLAGSGVLTLARANTAVGAGVSRFLFGKDPAKITQTAVGVATNAAMATAMLQFFIDNPDAASEVAYDKIAAALVLGAGFVAAKRPVDDGVLKNFPSVADAILTVPRAGMINLVQNIRDNPEQQALLKRVQDNPESLDEKELRTLMQGFREGDLSEATKSVTRPLTADETRKIQGMMRGGEMDEGDTLQRVQELMRSQ